MDEFPNVITALAHEIKNPAAVALAHVNLLRLSGKDENLSRHLNHIEAAITDICKLVHEMLTATHTREEPANADLHKILTDILETYRAAWPAISFTFNSGGVSALPCRGTATSLRMIFSNIIKNAVEAIELGGVGAIGRIEIAAHCNDASGADTLTVAITDSGNKTAAEKPHGNGLGLAICKNLAAGLGASLCVKQFENGCCVTVKLTRCPSFA